MLMKKQLLHVTGKAAYAIKSIFISAFSLFSILLYAQDEAKILNFKKIATEVNCILEKPQDLEEPFLLKILTNCHNIKLNENSLLSNFIINCDFYKDKKIIPISNLSFGDFSTSNFKPVFVEYNTTNSKSMITIPLKYITIFMLNYLKEKDLESELKDVDRVRISLMLYDLTPSASKERITFLTNEVSFSKNELLLFITKVKSYDNKLTPNEISNRVYK